MRSLMVATTMALVTMTMAATGSAGEPSPQISATRPKIELLPKVRVVGFHRAAGQNGAYSGGGLGLAVDVENTSDTPMEGVLVKLDVGDDVLESKLTLPAKSTRSATFNDSDGLTSSCKPKPYSITLAAAGVNTATRAGRVTPSCKFTSSLEQTWNQMSPDRVEAQTTGNVYLTAPTLVTAPVCGKGPTMKVRIVSKAQASSPSIIVQAKDWSATAQIKSQTAAAFPIAPQEQKELLLTPVSSGDGDVAPKLKLGIVDWTKSLGGHTSDGGIFVNTQRSCTLDVGLD